jgi:hypothetical protein
MHPVARVSIKYWNNLRMQHSILVLDFIVPLSHYLEYIFCVYEPPEDGRQTGPKHVV